MKGLNKEFNSLYLSLGEVCYDLRINHNLPETTIADTIDYVRNTCKNCSELTAKCEKCSFHKLMKEHCKERMFQRWIYKNLRDTGTCFINQDFDLTEEQLFDLKVFGFTKIETKKASCGGLIIKVLEKREVDKWND